MSSTDSRTPLTLSPDGYFTGTVDGFDVVAKYDDGHMTCALRDPTTGVTVIRTMAGGSGRFTMSIPTDREVMVYRAQYTESEPPQREASVLEKVANMMRGCGMCVAGTCCLCTAVSCLAAVSLGQAVADKASSVWNNWRGGQADDHHHND